MRLSEYVKNPSTILVYIALININIEPIPDVSKKRYNKSAPDFNKRPDEYQQRAKSLAPLPHNKHQVKL